jgi:conjugal transfer pilus assembly protein TrbC
MKKRYNHHTLCILLICIGCITNISLANQKETLIFISKSMPEPLLRQYAEETKHYGGRFVLRGFVDGSMKETMVFLKRLGDSGVRATIDPKSFQTYKITRVPTIVLTEQIGRLEEGITPYHDKVSGAVSLGYALDLMK